MESEMSVADASTVQHSAMSTIDGGDGKDDDRTYAYLLAFSCLFCLVAVAGLSVTGVMGHSDETTEDGSGADDPAPPGTYIDGGRGGGPPKTKPTLMPKTEATNATTRTTTKTSTTSTTTTTAKPTTTTKTTTTTTKTTTTTRKTTTTTRKTTTTKTTTKKTTTTPKKTGILFCVTGTRFVSAAAIQTGLCDYAIFRDLALVQDSLNSLYGDTQWQTFSEAFENSRKTRAGISFDTAHAARDGSTVQEIPKHEKWLTEMVHEEPYIVAMGFLDLFFSSVNMNVYHPSMKAFKKFLTGESRATLFIGGYLTNQRSGDRIAQELQSISGLTFLILQTHVTTNRISPSDTACKSHLVSYAQGRGVHGMPTFRMANATVGTFRRYSSKLQILFSSTLGVVLYVASKGATLNKHNQPCAQYDLNYHDTLCSAVNSKVSFQTDQTEWARYQAWKQHDVDHFMSWEDQTTIDPKMKAYIRDAVDGWAVFNIELDEHKVCDKNSNFELLKHLSKKARNRTP